MNSNISPKSKLGITVPYVLLVCTLCLAMTMTHVYKKMHVLSDMEQTMDRRLRNIEMIEGRIGRLHNELSSYKRRRRDTSSENQTANAQQGDNDSSDEADDFQNVEKQHDQTTFNPMGNFFYSTSDKPADQHDDDEDDGVKQDEYRVKDRKTCENNCEHTGGAVYTRWGRTTCGNQSELVYSGIVGGSHYTHTGGAVNPLCLPKEPIFDKFVDGDQAYAQIYGTEYERQSDAMFTKKNARKFFDENMPCAVCRSPTRQSAVMIPARNICVIGWTSEYNGYLMAGHISHNKGSKYICVDGSPEVTDSGFRDEDGQLFYTVEAHCGSLPCPDYIQGRELTCVVCTK